MIDPDGLRAFLAVVEARHFVRAADALKVTQSVVSKRLSRLEDQLGARLVQRGRRAAVVPTRAGRLFVAEASGALAALDQAARIGRNIARGASGPLRYGYVFSAALAGLVPALARAVRAALPHIEQQPRLLETPEQLAALAEGRLDLGIVRPRPSYPAGLSARVIHREPMLLALDAQHPLAQLATIEPAALCDERFIVPQFHERVGQIDEIRHLADLAQAPMPDVVATGDFVTALSLAAGGAGVVLAPRSLARLQLDGIAFRSLTGHDRQLELVLCQRDDAPSAAVAAVLGALPEARGQ